MIPAFQIVSVVGPLVTYAAYNMGFFSLVSNVLDTYPARWKTNVVACTANFVTFIALSLVELPLTFNWTIVAALFALEIKLLFRAHWTDCVLGAEIGGAVGLSATIIMRSVCAIILDVPLTAVGGDLLSIKALPISLGFLLAAITLRCINIPHNHRVLGTIRNERRVMLFLIAEMLLCYLYLCLNLLLHYNNLNSLVIKLWSLKTAVFVSLGVVLAIWFAYRMASTLGQAERRATLAREIERDKKTNLHLRELAEHDILTGCFTRGYAERSLDTLMRNNTSITIVFADLDGLKQVNDQLGHEEGDVYLVAAASALDQARGSSNDFVARYGGDEFLVVLTEPLSPTQVGERMKVASESLRDTAHDEKFPYTPHISWGYSITAANENLADAIARADKAMYRNKHTSRN